MADFIAYYRVSTSGQAQSGLGLEAQKHAVLDFINGNGNRLIAEFTEVESGKRSDRPQLNKSLDQCGETGAKLVIARLDRLARNAAFLLTLRDSGVEFVAADMPDANRQNCGSKELISDLDVSESEEESQNYPPGSPAGVSSSSSSLSFQGDYQEICENSSLEGEGGEVSRAPAGPADGPRDAGQPAGQPRVITALTTHPDWRPTPANRLDADWVARTRPEDWRRNNPAEHRNYGTVGDRVAAAWEAATSYPWTRGDHANVRRCLDTVEREAFFAWVLAEWPRIIEAKFGWRTRYPAPATPHMGFLIKNVESFLELWRDRDRMDEILAGARESNARCQARERVDWRVVEVIQADLWTSWAEACEEADRLAPLYEHLPFACHVRSLIADLWLDYKGSRESYRGYLRRLLPLAEAIWLAEEDGDELLLITPLIARLALDYNCPAEDSVALARVVSAGWPGALHNSAANLDLVVLASTETGDWSRAVELATRMAAEYDSITKWHSLDYFDVEHLERVRDVTGLDLMDSIHLFATWENAQRGKMGVRNVEKDLISQVRKVQTLKLALDTLGLGDSPRGGSRPA